MIHSELDVADLLSKLYGIHESDSIERIDNGDWNQIYKVEAIDKSILRISHRRKTQEQLTFELSILSILHDRLPYIPRIKPTKKGELFGLYHSKVCFPINSSSTYQPHPSQLSLNVTDMQIHCLAKKQYNKGHNSIEEVR